MRNLIGTLVMMALVAVSSADAQVNAQPNAVTVPPSPAQSSTSIASAPYGVERSVPVASHALPRGATISPADFAVINITVRNALRSAAAAESGWVTRRPVAAGEALVEPAVGPPALVASGQPVTFVSDRDGIRLSIRGTAASAGALGDRIWVRVEAGRRLRGLVIAPGTVRADTTSLR